MKHKWLWWRKEDLRTELRQLADEGRDTRSVAPDFERLLAEAVPEDAAFQEAANELLDRAARLPEQPDRAVLEPSGLDAIRAQRPAGPRALEVRLSGEARRDRVAGAWLGRCAGCLLGKPVEGVGFAQLRAFLERRGCEGIPDYLWRLPGLTEADCEVLGRRRLWGFRGTQAMPEDDDTNYTVMALALVKEKGLGFAPADVADFWLQNVPLLHTCTAERAAYRNFTDGIEPPRSAVVRNPYREWIGAQIRGDFFGYAAPGQPERAAGLAWRDACISHVKNGIYGEMWVAAMLAAAAAEADVRRVVELGLGEIPARSRLAAAVRDVLDGFAAGTDYASAVTALHRRWDERSHHDWCHTLANAQVVALALLYGEGDFGKAIARAVYPAFDTDCNGATVGSIMGMLLGARALPETWTGVLNDTIHTGLAGYHTVRISALAEETMRLQQGAQT